MKAFKEFKIQILLRHKVDKDIVFSTISEILNFHFDKNKEILQKVSYEVDQNTTKFEFLKSKSINDENSRLLKLYVKDIGKFAKEHEKLFEVQSSPRFLAFIKKPLKDSGTLHAIIFQCSSPKFKFEDKLVETYSEFLCEYCFYELDKRFGDELIDVSTEGMAYDCEQKLPRITIELYEESNDFEDYDLEYTIRLHGAKLDKDKFFYIFNFKPMQEVIDWNNKMKEESKIADRITEEWENGKISDLEYKKGLKELGYKVTIRRSG